MDVRTLESFDCNQQPALCLRSHSNLLGNGPHKGTQFPGNGDHDLIGIFAFGHQVAIPFAEPYLGFPADRLDRWGELFQTQLEVTTDLGRIPIRPGAFDQSMTRMRIPSLGNAALLTTPPTGIFRGCEPEIIHELSGVIEARQVSELRYRGHRDGALDAAQRLESFDHG